MNPFFTFVLGLLAGWLIEWLIDYYYWRRRRVEGVSQPVRAAEAPVRFAEPAPAKPVKDDLKVIKGIGPVIEGMLNAAGIFTFEQLGKLTATDLRAILGKAIERLADEESLLQQARDLARKSKG